MKIYPTRTALRVDVSSIEAKAASYSDHIRTTSFTYSDFARLLPTPAKWMLFRDDALSEYAETVLVCCALLEYLQGRLAGTSSIIGIFESDYADILAAPGYRQMAPSPADFLFDDIGTLPAACPYRPDDFSVGFVSSEPEVGYTGKLPDDILEHYAKSSLMSYVNSEAYLGAFGAYERFDLPDPDIDPLPLLSCGREVLPWPVEHGLPAGTSFQLYSSLEWTLDDDALDRAVAETEYGRWQRKIIDLSAIWCSYQNRALTGLRIPTKGDRPQAAFSVRELEEAAARVARQLGIDEAVAAYYSGVPVSDIVK